MQKKVRKIIQNEVAKIRGDTTFLGQVSLGAFESAPQSKLRGAALIEVFLPFRQNSVATLLFSQGRLLDSNTYPTECEQCVVQTVPGCRTDRRSAPQYRKYVLSTSHGWGGTSLHMRTCNPPPPHLRISGSD